MPRISAEIHLDSRVTELVNKAAVNGVYDRGFTAVCRLFMRAIARNDVKMLHQLLQSVSEEQRYELMNGRTNLLGDDTEEEYCVWHCASLVKQLSVIYPLSTAVVYQSLDCFKELINLGCDPFLNDVRGNNLLHLFVYAYKDEPSDTPVMMYDFLLSRLKTSSERRRLLYQASDDGLRPLDLAAKLCCPRLFRAYLYTEGAYRTIIHQRGKIVTNRFHLPSRLCHTEKKTSSFLWILVWMDDTRECAQTISAILNIPAVAALVKRRLAAVIWYLVGWFLARCMHGILFFSLDLATDYEYRFIACNSEDPALIPNQTFVSWVVRNREQVPYGYQIAIAQCIWGVLYGLSTVAINIGEITHLLKGTKIMGVGIWHKFTAPRFVNCDFFRVTMIVLALSFLLTAVLQIQSFHDTFHTTILAVLFLIIRILIVFSLMYFLQLIPVAGGFVIGFQKMLAALAKFAILQGFAMFLFSTLFRHVQMYFCRLGYSSCNFIGSFYTTFLIMLNMVDVVPDGGECSHNGVLLLKCLHVMYVFIVSVLTINYLIAVMSSVYSYYTSQMGSVVTVHRLYACLVIERRIRMIRALFKKEEVDVCQTEMIDVEEVDRDFNQMANLRLGDGPFGEYSST